MARYVGGRVTGRDGAAEEVVSLERSDDALYLGGG